MRAITVKTFSAVAVPAEHLEAVRPAIAFEPLMKRACFSDFSAVCRAVVVHVIDRQELSARFPSAGAGWGLSAVALEHIDTLFSVMQSLGRAVDFDVGKAVLLRCLDGAPLTEAATEGWGAVLPSIDRIKILWGKHLTAGSAGSENVHGLW